MELLIGLIVELLFVALAPLFAIVGSLLGAILDLILTLLGLTIRRHARNRGPDGDERADPVKAPVRAAKRGRRVWHVVLVAPAVLVGVGLLVVNLFFFAPTVRWAADLAASRAGYTVDIGTVEGSLWTGKLTLGAVRIVGQTDDQSAASVTAGLIDINLAMTSLLSSTVRLDTLTVTDLDMTVQKRTGPEVNQPDARPEGRAFEVETLAVTNAVVVVVLPDGQRHRLEIDTARAAPLRSRWAAVDLLFRSNLDATIDGAKLVVRTEVIDGDGRRTEWQLESLDLRRLAAFTNAAPVRWFDGGTVSASMQDEWRREDMSIDSAWQINLRNARVAAPDGAGMTETVLVRALSKVAEARGGDLELGFRLVLDEEGFRDSASGDLSAWWAAMVKGIARAIAERDDADAAETEGRLQGFTQGLRNLLGIERR